MSILFRCPGCSKEYERPDAVDGTLSVPYCTDCEEWMDEVGD